MTPEVLFAVSLVVTTILTILIMSAVMRWRRGRGLMGRTSKVRVENEERIRRAKQESSQGRREVVRALFQLLIAALLVFFLGFLLGGFIEF